MSIVATDEIESERKKHPRLQIRRFRARELRSAPFDQSADRGVATALCRRVDNPPRQSGAATIFATALLNGELETCVQFAGLRRSEGILGISNCIARRSVGVRAKRES